MFKTIPYSKFPKIDIKPAVGVIQSKLQPFEIKLLFGSILFTSMEQFKAWEFHSGNVEHYFSQLEGDLTRNYPEYFNISYTLGRTE